MSGERKPVWPRIAALLIGLPLLYVASFGPACWISDRMQPEGNIVSLVYRPVLWLWINGPDWIQTGIANYASIGSHSNVSAGYEPPEIHFDECAGEPRVLVR